MRFRKKNKKACHFEPYSRTTYTNHRTVNIPVEVIRLEDRSFHMIVSATINGITGDLIIDTGASVTVIDKRLFSQTEETEEQDGTSDMQSGSVTGQISDVKIVKIKHFKIGGMRVKGLPVASINLDYVNDIYDKQLNRSIIGLLGCDFCVKYNVLIDYQNNLLICRNRQHSD